MALSQAARAWGIATVVFLAVLFCLFGGNQRLALADEARDFRDIRLGSVAIEAPTIPEGLEDLAPRIICRIFTRINEIGDPFPYLDPGSFCPRESACADGVDNDGDGRTDTADPSCHLDFDANNPNSYEPHIDAEDLEPPAPACSDGLDNDRDGFRDADDPNCHTDGDPTNASSYNSDGDEAGDLPACWNGVDDDGDGLIDSDDPGCASATDNNEVDGGGPPPAHCADGIDNDEDGFIDGDDPNCHTDGDPTNTGSYNPDDNEAGVLPACWNGLDDDDDGLVDNDDPGCSTPTDNDETDPIDGDDGNGDTGNGGGGPSGNSGGSRGGGGGGTVTGLIARAGTSSGGTAVATTTQKTTTQFDGIQCDMYLTEFIKFGRENNEEQVRRLQHVLREYEDFNVEVHGVYDVATLSAVHAFQTKYADDILHPWGISYSTGYVYLTTRKKINEIYCNNQKKFPLTAEEQAKVNETRAALEQRAQAPSVAVDVSDPEQSEEEEAAVGPSVSPLEALLGGIGGSEDESDQTASAIQSIPNEIKRIRDTFWNRVRALFQQNDSP